MQIARAAHRLTEHDDEDAGQRKKPELHEFTRLRQRNVAARREVEHTHDPVSDDESEQRRPCATEPYAERDSAE